MRPGRAAGAFALGRPRSTGFVDQRPRFGLQAEPARTARGMPGETLSSNHGGTGCEARRRFARDPKMKKAGRFLDRLLAFWCPRRDSNPHTLRHMDLNHARLPIPPRGLTKKMIIAEN